MNNWKIFKAIKNGEKVPDYHEDFVREQDSRKRERPLGIDHDNDN